MPKCLKFSLQLNKHLTSCGCNFSLHSCWECLGWIEVFVYAFCLFAGSPGASVKRPFKNPQCRRSSHMVNGAPHSVNQCQEWLTERKKGSSKITSDRIRRQMPIVRPSFFELKIHFFVILKFHINNNDSWQIYSTKHVAKRPSSWRETAAFSNRIDERRSSAIKSILPERTWCTF